MISALFLYGYFQYKNAYDNNIRETVLARSDIEFNGAVSSDQKYNVLLLGTDARNGENSRADTIMVAQFDQKANKSKLISIMRDSYVEIPGHGFNKINAAYANGGVETLRETLQHNFDIDIHYYVIINFTGFSKVVDTAFPDGVEIDVEKDMSKGINNSLAAGFSTLNGEQLLDYVRFRQDEESDFGRVRRQQEVLKVLSSEFSEINNLVKLPKVIGTISPYVKTNLDTKLLLSMGQTFLIEEQKRIETLRVPLDDTYTDERYEHAGLVLELDLETNKAAIDDFLNE
ncbi:LCP family protein [Bacillus sp. THAF10]|uniref:LCP family protein n=1 Tax=Bacillus sp. THAF10 TaxID=2587848 RepID=UPI0020A650C8|nr:LCP family protein [Bacillus sp. THAF10]